ncbi:universal stress protein [Deinococcus hopiensis]|uniref:Nucleotide-binding universal stress protein, UspA family n=1 Tax=Deinococcus hopiensis KR-140 TaxID=695939 RepID=A0A1W1UWF2_9DEIO|nr:universal stress protein [Deinococcus hopiensis]SMB85380.1 Nucleotide-binding universal stress protein, UspA family [Deinococcus hopiensis KR-140]
MFRHIVVLADRHPASVHAARHAYELTRALGGRVTLLHVLEGNTSRDREAAEQHVKALSVGARRPPHEVILPLGNHDVRHKIATFAAQHQVDLIVIGLSGDGSLLDEALGRLGVSLTQVSGVPVHLAGCAGGFGAPRSSRWNQVAETASVRQKTL